MKTKEKNGCAHGHLSIKLFFCLLLILPILECTKPVKKVNSIKIFYLPERMLVPLALTNCDDIFINYNLLKDTTISDKETINKVVLMSDNLEVLEDTSSPIDYRIRCTIKFSDESKKVICLGAFFGISCNGVNMKDDSTFLYTIKGIIYKK